LKSCVKATEIAQKHTYYGKNFWTPFQAKTKDAFDSVMNQKKGVNTISYLKKGNKG